MWLAQREDWVSGGGDWTERAGPWMLGGGEVQDTVFGGSSQESNVI